MQPRNNEIKISLKNLGSKEESKKEYDIDADIDQMSINSRFLLKN